MRRELSTGLIREKCTCFSSALKTGSHENVLTLDFRHLALSYIYKRKQRKILWVGELVKAKNIARICLGRDSRCFTTLLGEIEKFTNLSDEEIAKEIVKEVTGSKQMPTV